MSTTIETNIEKIRNLIPTFTLNNTTPFTYRDGYTFLQMLEVLKFKLNEVIEQSNTQNDVIAEYIVLVEEIIEELQTQYGDFTDDIEQRYQTLLGQLIGYTITVGEYTYTAEMMDGSPFTAYTLTGTDKAIDDKLGPAVLDMRGYVNDETITIRNTVTSLDGRVTVEVDTLNSRITSEIVGVDDDTNARVCNVKRHHGAVGDGGTDDGPAINAALTQCKNVFIPEGVYLTNETLLLPDDSKLIGAGRNRSRIVLGTGAPAMAEVIATANFDPNENGHTNYIENVEIGNLHVDGNAFNRSPVTSPRGAAIAISTARNVWIHDVTVINAGLHGVDIRASRYQIPGRPFEVVPGPSEHVVVERVDVFNSRRDDGITTHDSGNIVIRDCRAIHNLGTLGEDYQNGFEVDDGSYNVTVANCYANGWARGYQVKGHVDHRPARDVSLNDNVAENCTLGLQIYHPWDDRTVEYPNIAKNVQVRGLVLKNVGNKPGDNGTRSAVNIGGYDNVNVSGLVLDGFSVLTNSVVYVSRGAQNVTFNDVLFRNIKNTINAAPRGLIQFYGDLGGPESVVAARNVRYVPGEDGDPALACPVVRVASAASAAIIEQVSATLTASGVGVWLLSMTADKVLSGLRFAGSANPVHVDLGRFAGDYPAARIARYDTGWRNLVLKAGFEAASGVTAPAIRMIGDRVIFRGGVTRTAGPMGTPRNWEAFADLPSGFEPVTTSRSFAAGSQGDSDRSPFVVEALSSGSVIRVSAIGSADTQSTFHLNNVEWCTSFEMN